MWAIDRPSRFVVEVVGRWGHDSYVSTGTYVIAPLNTILMVTYDSVQSVFQFIYHTLAHTIVHSADVGEFRFVRHCFQLKLWVCVTVFSRGVETDCSTEGGRGLHLERGGLVSFLHGVREHQSIGVGILSG